ncbi:MAG: ribonuclease P protein component 4 [Candidatus Woesearchaeota archaeon]
MIPKKIQKKIASERIEILFKEAKKVSKQNLQLSNRYITLARKISTKLKVRIPKEYKKLFCKNCYKYFLPGKTLRTRTKNKKLIYFCYNCKHITRYPFKKT